MFVYKCIFDVDNGYYVFTAKEVVISPRVIDKDDILKLLYDKYNDYDTVIKKLLVLPMCGGPKIV